MSIRNLIAFSSVTLGLAVGAVLISMTPAHAAGSAENIFTVGNYPVEARAKDAVTAKNMALADGQQAALRSLFRRLVPVTAYRKLKAMPPVKVNDFVDGVSVRSERNSTTDYIATLDFSFQPAAVRDVLRRNQIPFVDSQALQTVLIPIYRAKADGPYESGQGFWFEAWKGLDLVHTLSPLKLETLKPTITPETIQSLLKNKNGADKIVADEYKSPRVLIAIAEPDATGKKLSVTLVGSDAVGSFNLQRSYRLNPAEKSYTAELAAIVGLGVLEGRWKAGKGGAIGGIDIAGSGDSAATSGDGAIQLIVEFGSLPEWNDIRTRILATDGAFDVAVGSVSARSAEISVRHAGGAQGLNAALATNGLTMSHTGSAWRVQSTF
ncbi:MAG: DUF2066 domain-containing protein [Hyphomicrobiaceae bacterium]